MRSIRDLVRRSVGIGSNGIGERRAPVAPPLVQRASARPGLDVGGLPSRAEIERAKAFRERAAPYADIGARVVPGSHNAASGRATVALTARAAARASVGLPNRPAAPAPGLSVRNAIRVEHERAPAGTPPMADAAQAAPGRGFRDEYGMNWVSRAAYERFGPPSRVQPEGVPVPFDPSQSFGTR